MPDETNTEADVETQVAPEEQNTNEVADVGSIETPEAQETSTETQEGAEVVPPEHDGGVSPDYKTQTTI